MGVKGSHFGGSYCSGSPSVRRGSHDDEGSIERLSVASSRLRVSRPTPEAGRAALLVWRAALLDEVAALLASLPSKNEGLLAEDHSPRVRVRVRVLDSLVP